METEAAHSDAELCFGKETRKQDMTSNGLHDKNSNSNDDCLEGASLLTNNLPELSVNVLPESEPQNIESYVKVKNLRKKRSSDMEINQNREDQNNNVENNEVNADFADNSFSQMTAYLERDASSESFANACAVTDCEKDRTIVGLTSPQIKKRKCEEGIVHQDNGKYNDGPEFASEIKDKLLEIDSLQSDDNRCLDMELLTAKSDAGSTMSPRNKDEREWSQRHLVLENSDAHPVVAVMPSCGVGNIKQFEQHDVSVLQTNEPDLTLKAVSDTAKAEDDLAEADGSSHHITVQTCRTMKLMNPYERKRRKSSDPLKGTPVPANEDDVKEIKSDIADSEHYGNLDNKLQSSLMEDHASRDESENDVLVAETSVSCSNCGQVTDETLDETETNISKGASVSGGPVKNDSLAHDRQQSMGLNKDKTVITVGAQSPGNRETSDCQEKVCNGTSCCNPSGKFPRQQSLEVETKVKEITSTNFVSVEDDGNLNVKESENCSQSLLCSHTGPDVRHAKKKLLILDVNGVLADIVPYVPNGFSADLFVSGKAVFKRPVCDDFIRFCFEKFDVGIWSSRFKRNVDMVVNFLFKRSRDRLLFCWDQSHCTSTGFVTLENRDKPLVLKELKKLWDKVDPNLPWDKGQYDESNTLLLDDSPYKALRNPPHTAIFPYPYRFRDLKDTSLAPGGDLRDYLEGVASAGNVQKYVEENPFGQQPITEANTSWNFYRMVMDSNGNRDQPEEDM